MALQQIDDAAWADDQPLDTAVLHDLHGNIEATHQDRPRHGLWSCSDRRDLFRWCSRVRSVIPLGWYLDPGVTKITIRIRHRPAAQTVDGLTLFASVDNIVPGVDQVPFPQVSTAVGSAVTGDTVTSLVLGSGELARIDPGWCLIFVGLKSDTGATVNITDGLGLKAPDQVVGWSGGVLFLETSNNTYGANEIPCAEIEIYDPVGDQTRGGVFQILRVKNTGAQPEIYTWPAMRGSSALDPFGYSSTSDFARTRALGYTDLISIEVEVTGQAALDDPGSSIDPGQPTGALMGGGLYRRSEDLFRTRTRVHHLGPSNDPSVEDGDFAGEALDKVTANADHNDGWETIAECLVGEGGQYTRDGVTRTRTGYSALAFLMAQHYEQEERFDRPARVDVRLQLTDPDRVSDAVTGPVVQLGTQDAPLPSYGVQLGPEPAEGQSAARLAGFFLNRFGGPDTLRAHALRGVWPVGPWAGAWTPVLLSIVDSESTRRLLRLQVRGEATDFEGITVYAYRRRIHLASWTVLGSPVPRLAGYTLGA